MLEFTVPVACHDLAFLTVIQAPPHLLQLPELVVMVVMVGFGVLGDLLPDCLLAWVVYIPQ